MFEQAWALHLSTFFFFVQFTMSFCVLIDWSWELRLHLGGRSDAKLRSTQNGRGDGEKRVEGHWRGGKKQPDEGSRIYFWIANEERTSDDTWSATHQWQAQLNRRSLCEASFQCGGSLGVCKFRLCRYYSQRNVCAGRFLRTGRRHRNARWRHWRISKSCVTSIPDMPSSTTNNSFKWPQPTRSSWANCRMKKMRPSLSEFTPLVLAVEQRCEFPLSPAQSGPTSQGVGWIDCRRYVLLRLRSWLNFCLAVQVNIWEKERRRADKASPWWRLRWERTGCAAEKTEIDRETYWFSDRGTTVDGIVLMHACSMRVEKSSRFFMASPLCSCDEKCFLLISEHSCQKEKDWKLAEECWEFDDKIACRHACEEETCQDERETCISCRQLGTGHTNATQQGTRSFWSWKRTAGEGGRAGGQASRVSTEPCRELFRLWQQRIWFSVTTRRARKEESIGGTSICVQARCVMWGVPSDLLRFCEWFFPSFFSKQSQLSCDTR